MKPCPFCGNKEPEGLPWTPRNLVFCWKCKVYMPLEVWNSRPPVVRVDVLLRWIKGVKHEMKRPVYAEFSIQGLLTDMEIQLTKRLKEQK